MKTNQSSIKIQGSQIIKCQNCGKSALAEVIPLSGFGRNEVVTSLNGDTITTMEPVFTFMTLFGKRHFRIKKYDTNTGKCISKHIITDETP